MICPTCGAQIDDDSKFCAVCGNPIDRPEDQQPEQAEVLTEETNSLKEEVGKEKEKENKTISGEKTGSGGMLNLLGLAAGTLFIVVGCMRISTAGTSISSTSFGGDFYTYTYQGIVAVSELLSSIEVTLGWILVAAGSAIDLYFLHKYFLHK